MTRKNSGDLESSGKIENVQERSFRKRKKKKERKKNKTRTRWWEVDKKIMADVLMVYSLEMCRSQTPV